jgi:putative transcriptional regulator
MQNKLREIRLGKELSQQALAERTGVSRQSIHAIEKGKYVPSTELALGIWRVFNRWINPRSRIYDGLGVAEALKTVEAMVVATSTMLNAAHW